jgi:hypothetical protein
VSFVKTLMNFPIPRNFVEFHDHLHECCSRRNDQQYALVGPFLYSINWLLHVSAVVCHQVAS